MRATARLGNGYRSRTRSGNHSTTISRHLMPWLWRDRGDAVAGRRRLMFLQRSSKNLQAANRITGNRANAPVLPRENQVVTVQHLSLCDITQQAFDVA
jgi:hypothetical protein